MCCVCGVGASDGSLGRDVEKLLGKIGEKWHWRREMTQKSGHRNVGNVYVLLDEVIKTSGTRH